MSLVKNNQEFRDSPRFQFSLRTMLIAVAVIAVGIAMRHELYWVIWSGVIVFSIWLSLSNISHDFRNRQL